jgi:hypothetical protein
MSEQAEGLAKITWDDPETGEKREFVLEEGATATIGRSEQHHSFPGGVSATAPVISFAMGLLFVDLATRRDVRQPSS